MKQVCVLLLALLMVCAGCTGEKENSETDRENEAVLTTEELTESASVEAAAEEKGEIRFNDLEWGCSPREAEESGSLDQLQIFWDEMFDSSAPNSVGDIVFPDTSVETLEFADDSKIMYQTGYLRMLNKTGKEVQVAGYDIYEINLYFAKNVINGVVSESKEEAMFYGAKYSFDDDFTDEMAEDLRQKLTGIYGTASAQKTDRKGRWYDSWYGANDTMVVLYYNPEFQSASIRYAWKKGDEFLLKAQQAREAELAGDVSGLGTMVEPETTGVEERGFDYRYDTAEELIGSFLNAVKNQDYEEIWSMIPEEICDYAVQKEIIADREDGLNYIEHAVNDYYWVADADMTNREEFSLVIDESFQENAEGLEDYLEQRGLELSADEAVSIAFTICTEGMHNVSGSMYAFRRENRWYMISVVGDDEMFKY